MDRVDHRNRGGSTSESRRVIVVGAGISGLTAAWRLQQRGVDVTVLESEPHVGGKLSSYTRDGFRINRGAGVFSGSYETLLALVNELDLQDQVSTPPTAIGLVRDGQPHYLRGEGLGAVVDFVRTPVISWRSKLQLLRLVRDAFRHRRDTGYDDAAGRAALDIESVGDYCDRRLNAELRDDFLAPLLRGIWIVDGAKMSIVDLYFLLTRFLSGGLRGYSGGIDFIARALADRLDVRRSSPVSRVENVASGVQVLWSEGGSAHEEIVDGVILSTCAPLVPPIHPGLEPEIQAILLEGLGQATYGTLRVALDKRPPSDVSFLCVPGNEFPKFGSVAFEHVISPDAAPPGKGLLAVFLTHEWASARMELSDDEWVDAVLPDLDRLLPGVADSVRFVEVSRWAPATIRPEVGTHRLIDQLHRAFDDDRRIQHAGDYLSVASVEGSAVSGEIAAKRLGRTLGLDRSTEALAR